MEKAPDAFRTISEVAQDLDLPQHVLRFWETRFAQIKPMKRGGGRRYYRPDDVDLLRGIRHLLYGEGYTIRGVQRLLKDEGIKFVQSVWKAGAPQPERSPAGRPETDDRPAPLARPLPGRAARNDAETERGRGLFGLLPSLLGSSHDEFGGASGERTEPRIEPSIEEIFAELPSRSPAEPTADEEDDDPSDTTLPMISAARALSPESQLLANGSPGGGEVSAKIPVDDLRKLRATLNELGECRSLLDAALTD
jgi:DNA-binding transcriptional MerR regulator